MTTATPSMSSFIRNRFVQAILLSGLFLQIGIWVRNFAVLLFVMDQTNNDPFAVSMISVAEFAPIFIFSFIGGTFADRWRPKRTMIWCDLLSAASIFAVMFTLVYGSWKAVFLATLISAILSQFSQPSGMKLFKLHVPEEQMQLGMSMYQTMFAVFMILGPVLGTFVYHQFGIDVAIGVMGVAFLLSAAALTFLPADRELGDDKPQTTLKQEMAAGFRYVLSSKLLTLLGVSFAAAGLAIGLAQPLTVFLVTERLDLPKENLQWFLTLNGVGMIIGGVMAMAMSKKMLPQKMLMLGMAVDAVMFSVCGLSTVTWITMTAQFLSGLVLPSIQIGINTMILKNTGQEFVGRVNGILTPLFMGSMVITMSSAGVLKNALSLMGVFQISAILFVIGLLVLLPIFNYSGRKEPETANSQPASQPSGN
ncbi:MFS transporter [Paenibacillus contaminans]|uniref:MFS transporter n=1 Tax=Paenibacillus contaminans TaxID=450362 RepID=A0A329MJU8_9BACL|nr:MFS transporter [Paenibacillus contaminans]RAV20105.1 MFS transporter [Paenibacillus contaminans]